MRTVRPRPKQGTLETPPTPTKGKENPTLPLRLGRWCSQPTGPDLGATYLGMDNFVSAESAGLAEAFATDFAHKRSSSGVDRHVAGEVIVSIEHLRKDGSETWAESAKGLESGREATTYLPPPPNQPSHPKPASPFVNCVTTDISPILQNRKLRLNWASNGVRSYWGAPQLAREVYKAAQESQGLLAPSPENLRPHLAAHFAGEVFGFAISRAPR